MNFIIPQDIQAITQQELPWENLAGTNVLITGASGFLPAYLVETLMHLNRHVLAKPAQVTALVRDESTARARFARYADRNDLSLLVQNVADPLASERDFNYILHAASQASPRFYKTDPVGTLLANVLGTYHLLETARRSHCESFLFFSSGDVYGSVGEESGEIREDIGGYLDPTDVRSCYGESKRMGETMCVAWAQQHGVPTRIVRPFHTYGPGMKLDDGRVFADFVRDILQGGPIVLHSDGSARRSFCYLADATSAFFAVLLKGETGQAYNVANPDQECSIAELADRLTVLYRSEGISVERKTRVDSAYIPSPIAGTKPSVEKLKKLGWLPLTSIEEGFSRTVQSYREVVTRGGLL